MTQRTTLVLDENVYWPFQKACYAANMTVSKVIEKLMANEVANPAITCNPEPAPESRPPRPASVPRPDNSARDGAIVQAAAFGNDYTEIGKRYGMTKSGVGKVLERHNKKLTATA